MYSINPMAMDRYRDRHRCAQTKSDPADALVLADLLRTDRDRHRPLQQDSDQVTAIAVLARAHQDAVAAAVHEASRLRSLLPEFFPAALMAFPTLHSRIAVTVLAAAPTPAAAAVLSSVQLRELLRTTRRNAPREYPAKLHAMFAASQWRQPAQVEAAMGVAVAAIVRTLAAALDAIKELETALDTSFERHPDAEILRSLPGLGLILGARVLGEFGDDPTRFADAPSRRRAYAGSAPITRASGKTTMVRLRRAYNRRLADACRWWAFNATRYSPGAKAFTCAVVLPATGMRPRCAGWPTSCSASCTTA